MPPVIGIIESAIYVKDVLVSIRFYEKILGIKVMDPLNEKETDERRIAFNVNDQHVFLIFPLDKQFRSLTTPGGTIPEHGATGEMHICFSISKDSLNEWRDHLAKNNVAIESEVIWPRGGTSLYFRDPDNHCIELATPGVWTIY